MILEIARTAKRVGLHKVLCNVRDMMGKISFIDSFQLSVMAASAFQGLQVAGVYRQKDIDTFVEIVVQNRGGNIRMFSKIEKAKEWLGVE